ncbi:hypothetical protein D3C74_377890 [compost metagenome]
MDTYNPILGKACVRRNENRNIRLSGNCSLAKAYAAGIQITIDSKVTSVAIRKDKEIDETMSSLASTNFHHLNPQI